MGVRFSFDWGIISCFLHSLVDWRNFFDFELLDSRISFSIELMVSEVVGFELLVSEVVGFELLVSEVVGFELLA